MARSRRETAASTGEATIRRIRDLNERIIDSARSTGSTSLEAYEELLRNVASFQEAAGRRGGEWVANFGKAQARLTRELGKVYPAAARRVTGQAGEAAGAAARQARRVPGVATAEGEAKGAIATEGDLPIARYDSLNAGEIVRRLPRLSKEKLGQIDAYERKHRNRKTVLDKIASLRS